MAAQLFAIECPRRYKKMDTFTTSSRCVSIGDPTMGLVNVTLPENGTFKLLPGCLIESTDEDEVIDLDSPGLFVVDSKDREEFENWYHEIGNETSYVIPVITQRLNEIEERIGGKVAFNWEEDLR